MYAGKLRQTQREIKVNTQLYPFPHGLLFLHSPAHSMSYHSSLDALQHPRLWQHNPKHSGYLRFYISDGKQKKNPKHLRYLKELISQEYILPLQKPFFAENSPTSVSSMAKFILPVYSSEQHFLLPRKLQKSHRT